MGNIRKIFFGLILYSSLAFAQKPDCSWHGKLSISASAQQQIGPALDNRGINANQLPCNIFVVYWYTDASTQITLLETEFDVTADQAGAAASVWVPGQSTGQFTNPQIFNNLGQTQFVEFAPWLRFQVVTNVSSGCTASALCNVYWTINGYTAPPPPLSNNNSIYVENVGALFNSVSHKVIISTFGYSCIALELSGTMAGTITAAASNDTTGVTTIQVGNYTNVGIYTFPVSTQFLVLTASQTASATIYLSAGSNCNVATAPPYALGSTVTPLAATGTQTSSIDQVYGAKTIELEVNFAGITHSGAIAGCNAQLKSSNDNINFATITATTNNLGAAGVVPDGASSQFIGYTTQPIGEYLEWVFTCGTYPTAGTIQFVPVFK